MAAERWCLGRSGRCSRTFGAVAVALVVSGGMAATARADATTVPCGEPAGGASGLVAAINQANSSTGPQTINLAPGCTYILTAPAAADDGLPIITGTTTIAGHGATIKRSSSAAFRILEVARGADLTLDRVTISGGAISLSGPTAFGGGILNGGQLTVTRSTISDNSVRGGGSSAGGGGIANNGTVVVKNSQLRHNTASATGTRIFAAVGGAVINRTAATMTIDGSWVADNSATSTGSSDILFIAAGGGIASTGTLMVTGTQITGNRTVAQGKNGHSNGAGVSIGDGTATFDSTNIVANTSHATGAGASAVGGGLENNGQTTLANSSVVANRASGASAVGGGIYNGFALVLNKSHVVGNVATATTGQANGGGIFNDGGTVELQQSSVVGNRPNNCDSSLPNC